jgi:hypothetical protein
VVSIDSLCPTTYLTRAEPTEATAEETLHTLKELCSLGLLPAGTPVSPAEADRDTIGEITEDGLFQIGEHTYDSPTRAARDGGADTNDGWFYWEAQLEDGSVQIPPPPP